MESSTTQRARLLSAQLYVAAYNGSRVSCHLTNYQTQDRMLKSAENWVAGFFGLEW